MISGLVTAAEMRAAEENAFAAGISADDLMEQAGEGIARCAWEIAQTPGICHVFFGKGNNGGDALVAARLLAAEGWEIREHPAASTLGTLPAAKLTALHAVTKSKKSRPASRSRCPVIALDGLLGTGARGEPRGATAEAICKINELRQRGARVIAIDIPSGLNPDMGVPSPNCVAAHWTATLGAVKSGLVTDTATPFVGRIELVPLKGVRVEGDTTWSVATPGWLRSLLPPRPTESHKGTFGRVSIVAGSEGFLGAACLASAAAVRAGAGLVTLFTDPKSARRLAGMCFPEVMVHATPNLRRVLDHPADVLAIGPGLGRIHDTHVLSLIRDFKGPAVVDADALNALAADPGLLRRAAGPRILTPHPGEMTRLEPAQGRSRRVWASDFSKEFQCFTLLKGARSVFARPDGTGVFNPTGSPGMASGGMGDVLTGTLAGLLPQIPVANAAPAAMWLCGRAAEIALSQGESEQSLRASDVIANLGRAFNSLSDWIP